MVVVVARRGGPKGQRPPAPAAAAAATAAANAGRGDGPQHHLQTLCKSHTSDNDYGSEAHWRKRISLTLDSSFPPHLRRGPGVAVLLPHQLAELALAALVLFQAEEGEEARGWALRQAVGCMRWGEGAES